MNILDIAIIIFILLESMNIIILYFYPEFKFGNGVSAFKEWQIGKEDENRHLAFKYMKNWVAGSKIVFVALLIVILILGTNEIKIFSLIAMIISVSTYYIKLHPIIKKLDSNEMINPKGYSKTLGKMILGFILLFTVAVCLYLI